MEATEGCKRGEEAVSEPLHTKGPTTVRGMPDFIGDRDSQGQTYSAIPCSFCHCYEGTCKCEFLTFEEARRVLLEAKD